MTTRIDYVSVSFMAGRPTVTLRRPTAACPGGLIRVYRPSHCYLIALCTAIGTIRFSRSGISRLYHDGWTWRR